LARLEAAGKSLEGVAWRNGGGGEVVPDPLWKKEGGGQEMMGGVDAPAKGTRPENALLAEKKREDNPRKTPA